MCGCFSSEERFLQDEEIEIRNKTENIICQETINFILTFLVLNHNNKNYFQI